MTTADSAPRALRRSLYGARTPVLPTGFAHGDSATHTMMHTKPAGIERGDVLFSNGVYRTVSSVLEIKGGTNAGGMAVYFTDGTEPETIPSYVMALTVYRPKTHRG